MKKILCIHYFYTTDRTGLPRFCLKMAVNNQFSHKCEIKVHECCKTQVTLYDDLVHCKSFYHLLSCIFILTVIANHVTTVAFSGGHKFISFIAVLSVFLTLWPKM